VRVLSAFYAAAFGAALIATTAFAAVQPTGPGVLLVPAPADRIGATTVTPMSKLPAGTPVLVMTNDELSTKANRAGDQFEVTVLNDVIDGGTVVIPKGTKGFGEVTFATNNSGFGKPGILSISLRYLELNGTKALLDGRYREEGANKNSATAATWFAVGVFSGFIKGKPGVIPKGRELKARTGEDIAFIAGSTPQPVASGAPAEPADMKAVAPADSTAGKEQAAPSTQQPPAKI
jgi:hypothetical protein